MKIILIKHFLKQNPLLHGVKLALGYLKNPYDPNAIKEVLTFQLPSLIIAWIKRSQKCYLFILDNW